MKELTFWFQKYVFNPWSSLGKRASWPKLLGGLSFHFFERSEMLVNGPIFRSPSETAFQVGITMLLSEEN